MSTKHAARYASQPNLAGLSTLPLGQIPRQPFAATVTGGLAAAAQQLGCESAKPPWPGVQRN